jgi:hypothetical protein
MHNTCMHILIMHTYMDQAHGTLVSESRFKYVYIWWIYMWCTTYIVQITDMHLIKTVCLYICTYIRTHIVFLQGFKKMTLEQATWENVRVKNVSQATVVQDYFDSDQGILSLR